MQIETTLRYDYTTIKIALKKLTIPNASEIMEQLSFIAGDNSE